MTTKRSEVASQGNLPKAGHAGAKRLLIAVCAVLLVVGLGACEKSQVITYKQGKYQGKTDTKPWDNEQFNGDQTAWERETKARQLSQNEYRRAN